MCVWQTTFTAEDGSARAINVRTAVAPGKLAEIAGRGTEKENQVKELVAAAVATGKMKESDCDEMVLNYLKVLPMEVVTTSIKDFSELDANEGLDNVTNRSSFFMGLIKQRDAGFINEDLTLPVFAEKAAKKAKFAAKLGEAGAATPVTDSAKAQGGLLGGDSGEAKKVDEESKTVMVKGLPFTATAADIATHFASCCESSSDMAVRIVMDKAKNESKGIAFIDFPTADATAKGVAMQGSELDGRKINVSTQPSCGPEHCR